MVVENTMSGPIGLDFSQRAWISARVRWEPGPDLRRAGVGEAAVGATGARPGRPEPVRSPGPAA